MFKKLYKGIIFWIELKIKSRTGGIIAVPREFWPKDMNLMSEEKDEQFIWSTEGADDQIRMDIAKGGCRIRIFKNGKFEEERDVSSENG